MSSTTEELPMLALTFRQPWADLILGGCKSIEIRSWTTKHRGQLIVHAGKTIDKADARRLGVEVGITGAYLGAVSIMKVSQMNEEQWDELRSAHLTAGPWPGEKTYAWHLSNPLRFDAPVAGNGKLGLFHPSSSIVQALQNCLIYGSSCSS